MIEIYYVNGVETPQEQIIVKKIFTNADRIRAMSDEELAKFLDCYCVSASWECPRNHEIKCHECWLEWLKKKVDG